MYFVHPEDESTKEKVIDIDQLNIYEPDAEEILEDNERHPLTSRKYQRVLTEVEGRRLFLAPPIFSIHNTQSTTTILMILSLIILVSGVELFSFFPILYSDASPGYPLYHFLFLISVVIYSTTALISIVVFRSRAEAVALFSIFYYYFLILTIFTLINLFMMIFMFPLRDELVDLKKFLFYWNFYSFVYFFLLAFSYYLISRLLRSMLAHIIPRVHPTTSTLGFSIKEKGAFIIRYCWPESRKFKIFILLSLLCIILGRIVNVLVPFSFKSLVDSLKTNSTSSDYFSRPYVFLFLFVCGRLLQGNVGIVSSAQKLLWVPVNQWMTKHIALVFFSHLHSLPHSFHTSRNTGEIIRALDKGTASVGSLFNSILFSVGPTLFDVFIAVVFFVIQFDIWFGLIIFWTMVLFVFLTIIITSWRIGFRRKMVSLEAALSGKAVDSLLNFETVKYFNAEEYEVISYSKCLDEYQQADWICQVSLILLNTIQLLIISIGALLFASLLAIHRLHENREMSVGDVVLLLSYIGQLYLPLNFLGTHYRSIQQHFVDMEKMILLLQNRSDISEPEYGLKMEGFERGEIEFGNNFINAIENVNFDYAKVISRAQSYEKKSLELAPIRGLSFKIDAGKTVALVGPSGAGKSTIIKLLFRFYDVQGPGTIKIDNIDIRKIALKSLRGAIGIVPQDTILFSESIFFNIRYASPEATESQVKEAANAARLVESTFDQGFSTKVGERGIKLSGGEKQRIAIARTILKNPKIVVLDEATSSLDSITEQAIQNQLEKMCRGRTTLIVAHRLSTIIHADKILVLNEGRIIEQGTHSELLDIPDGLYRSLWMRQLAIK